MTDGDENIQNISYGKVHESVKESGVGLIIVGTALEKMFQDLLTDLCHVSKEGVFIESADSEDLHVAF